MTPHTTMAFPVDGTLHGMDALAIWLNSAQLRGAWHFAKGTRYDHTIASIVFDVAGDAMPSWRRYCENRPG